jgi:Domain of unknown function (DUF4389)
MTTANPEYPARVDINFPDHLSRLLIFVKWLLAIPHYIALIFLGIGVYVVLVISWFAVLITGRYPPGLFNYMVGVFRWATRVQAYVFLMADAYPPFTLEDDPAYPVRVEIDYPEHVARWRPLIHWLLAIPALIAAALILFVAEICVLIAWFAILFTGRYPQALFDVVLIAFRWSIRTNVFNYWMEEQYPPFVWA